MGHQGASRGIQTDFVAHHMEVRFSDEPIQVGAPTNTRLHFPFVSLPPRLGQSSPYGGVKAENSDKILPIHQQHTCTVHQWQSMLGLLMSTEYIVQLGMLHIRHIQFALLDQWSPFRGYPSEQLTISLQVKEALRWWTIL